MQEKIIETKTCKQCNSSFDITDRDMKFYNKISPKFDGETFQIPSSDFCPDCRLQRRLSFRNVRKLYKTKSALSWKIMLSMYKPDSWYTIYSPDEWWSDKWNPLDFWIEFDFDKWFFEQFDLLLHKAPLAANSLILANIENSDYINWANNTKNSYLSFSMWDCDSVLYSEAIFHSNNSIDCYNVGKLENSYECVNSKNLYLCFFSANLIDSNDCLFCFDSWSLNNCIWCVNLFNKSYYIFNKKYSKEDYFIKKDKLISDFNKLKQLSYDFFEKQIKKENLNLNNEDSTWEYLINTKKCNYCYNVLDWENLKYCFYINWGWNNSYDISTFWQNINNSYESCAIWYWVSNILFSFWIYWDVSNLMYCFYCVNWTKNCFWCIWLSNKQYCIFNKQYSKEKYEELVAKIIKNMQKNWEWWNYFPASMSLFWYNESSVCEIFPLNKKQAEQKWFNWTEYETPFPKVDKIIRADQLPENISDIPDDILNRAIECEITKKPFKIIRQELEFYRKYKLPIPKRHPDRRHIDRLNFMRWINIYDRKCDKCSIDMKTTFSPDKEETVYCEKCYNSEVY